MAFGQLYVGAGSGVNIADAQDQKFIYYDLNDKLTQKILTNDIEGSFSFLNNINISFWTQDKIFNNIGIRFDYSDWTYSSLVDEFSANITPPISLIKQERTSYFISFLKNIKLAKDENHFSQLQNIYLYFGIGGGLVHSEVKHGADNIGVGFNLLSGISYPFISNLSLVGEVKFAIAPDVDATPKPGWQVHTSGTPTPFRLGPHHDTRFFGITFGINYRVSK